MLAYINALKSCSKRKLHHCDCAAKLFTPISALTHLTAYYVQSIMARFEPAHISDDGESQSGCSVLTPSTSTLAGEHFHFPKWR